MPHVAPCLNPKSRILQNQAKIVVTQKILHKGGVNRARYMPQNPSIIASKGPDAEVYIFDCTRRHTSQPDLNPEGLQSRNLVADTLGPDLTLAGHEEQV